MNLYLFVVARSAATWRCIHLTAFDGLPQSASLLRNEKHEFIGRGYDVLVWIEETSSSVTPRRRIGSFHPGPPLFVWLKSPAFCTGDDAPTRNPLCLSYPAPERELAPAMR